jgi:hypothetical protein
MMNSLYSAEMVDDDGERNQMKKKNNPNKTRKKGAQKVDVRRAERWDVN